MPDIQANGLRIHYDDQGNPDDPVMLLIMGFGAQMILWPQEFIDAIIQRGFRVIRYDNRDVGLSEKLEGVKAPGLLKLTIYNKLGLTPKVPYSLADMAADGIGLLDALGIKQAHIVGASMGGMIAQHLAATYPDRVLSFTQVFSTTGNPKLPPARKEAIRALISRPSSETEDALVEHGVMIARTIGSPAYPAPEDRLRERARMSIRRSYYPQGATRHLSAIASDGDRRAMLRGITVPTLVLHGEADPLVPCEGGRDTAECIPSATIKTVPGWGHDLPLELLDDLSDTIADHARSVTAA